MKNRNVIHEIFYDKKGIKYFMTQKQIKTIIKITIVADGCMCLTINRVPQKLLSPLVIVILTEIHRAEYELPRLHGRWSDNTLRLRIGFE
jgi:hypothetical protein